MPIDRTSRPEPQANGPHLSASGYSEKQCRPTCRSPRERRPEDQTTDAMDIEVPETRFRGRSQALLYNEARPHQGHWCFGETPMQTFLDALPMIKEKMIVA